jgi:hypothetical protein
VGSGKRTRSARGIIVRDWLSYTTVEFKTLILGPERRVRRTPPGPHQGRFRRWRRSRPFWGGLLLILAGVEMLLIPLASLLIHGGVKLVIYIGIGGVFGVLIGVLLITAGVLLWISPAHKTFYAIAGAVLAILSFPASNLGGFFLGMLLGITGGSLAFAWTQNPAADADTGPLRPVAEELTPDGTALDDRALDDRALDDRALDDRALDDTAPDLAGPGWAGEEDEEAPGGRHRSGGRLLAGATMPVLLASSLLTGHAAVQRPSMPDSPRDCILWIICWPSPTPPPLNPAPGGSPDPTSSPAVGPAAGDPSAISPVTSPSPAAGGGQPTAAPGASDSAGAGTGAAASRARVIARADLGLEASTATTVLTAGSATLDGLAYQGTVKMPVADGGEQTMMVFTLNSMSLSGNVTTTVTQDGKTTVTAASSLDFSGGITLYATKLSGSLLGIPTTLTPGNVLSLLLQLVKTVTPLVPLTMTNVTTDQPLVIAGSLQAANLSVTA